MKSKGLFLPIRTKILAALLLLTIGVLVASLLSSRSLFRQDKMAYLFDINQESASSKAVTVNSVMQQWQQAVSALSLYVDRQNHSLGAAGNILFDQIRDLEVVTADENDSTGVYSPVLEKARPGFEAEAAKLRAWVHDGIAKGVTYPRVEMAKNPAEMRIALRRETGEPGKFVIMGFKVGTQRVASMFESSGDTKTLLLNESLEPVQKPDPEVEKLWGQIRSVAKFSGLHNVSQLVQSSEGSYLISFARLDDYSLYVLTMTPEAVVTRVLHDLLLRTLYVAALALCLVVVLSILFAKSLTSNLDKLLEAVRRVSKGNFDLDLNISSRDETAQLAESFQTMSEEIRRLLVETAEKSRMEGELKTAQAVQATLFPEKNLEWNGFQVAGIYRSASECGGDWWYYKTCDRFIYLVIADATGHGAPAALITSAARSAFSLLANENPVPVDEVARSLNRAVFETSKGQLMMTALFLRVDTKNGSVQVVNCSHEFPLVVDPAAEKPDCKTVDPSRRLGQGLELNARVEEFQLLEGQTLALYTDGLTDIVSPEGRSFGERRVLKSLSRVKGSPAQMLSGIVDEIDGFSQGTEYIDDVTIVLIQRTGLRPAVDAAT